MTVYDLIVMGANTHPTTRVDTDDTNVLAMRLKNDLSGVKNVDSVRIRELNHRDGHKVEIELENPASLNPEVMRVLANHGVNLTSGCLDSGMNPFRVYL